MGRVGLAGRVLLILMAALLSVIVASVGLDVLAYRRTVGIRPVLAPRVVHAAGVIALLRSAGPAQRKRVLHLGSNALLAMAIADARPEPTPDDLPAPHLQATLRELVGDKADGLRAFTDAAMATPPADVRRYGDGRITKVIAPLGDGRYLLIRWADPPPSASFKVLGLPPSVLAGILGFTVAGLALFTTLREVRPLRRLTASVSAFDGSAPGEPVAGGGAPDIQHLADAVHGMQTRVAGLLAERSFLIGAISHDLKTYLTRLHLRSEAMPAGEGRNRLVADIEAMTELVETSLAFARGTTTSASRREVDLGDLAATEVEERNALGPPLHLEGRYDDGAVVIGDPVALRRVLCNVIDNAMKFGRSAVTVHVNRTPEVARVAVDDDGPGIPPADRAGVFDPYVRLEQSRSRRTGGSGLGLAIARQIVETHGGTITVADASSGGACVVIELPAARRDPPGPGAAPRPAWQALPARPRAPQGRVVRHTTSQTAEPLSHPGNPSGRVSLRSALDRSARDQGDSA